MGVLLSRMKTLYGIDITQDSEQLLLDYLHAVLEVNEHINLTRIVSEEDALVSHLEDSLSGLPYMQSAPEGLYGDLGTGGGFPGVPLGIVSGRKTVLIDSVKKKIRALENILNQLGINGTFDFYDGRIEDLARLKNGEFSVLTARALSSLASLLELACPLLCIGGRLICYKAHPSDDELLQATHIEKLLEMKQIACDYFSLSDGSQRCIIMYEKVGQEHIKLPRRVGLAQKNPLE